MKAKYKLILGRRKNYPLNIELEVYKGADRMTRRKLRLH